MSSSPTLKLVDDFLHVHSWELVSDDRRFRHYSPPPNLGVDKEYSLTLPSNEEAPGAGTLLSRAADTLARLHDLSADQVRIVLSVPATIVSVQIEGEATSSGSIPLPRFEGLVDKIRRALVDTASFVLTDAPLLDEMPDAAQSYVAQCHFLQTEVGSFIAKVQLPAAQTLADPSFFKQTAVTSDDVNTTFADVVDFSVNQLLVGNAEPLMSAEGLETYSNVLNVNVLADLASLFKDSVDDSVTFSFLSAERHRSFRSGEITPAKLERLDNFVSYARKIYSIEFPIDITGKIVELRSRNPKGNRNHVLLQGIHENKAVYVGFSLPRNDYWFATQAHAEGKSIRVAGFARHMKTQLTIAQLELFQILDVEK